MRRLFPLLARVLSRPTFTALLLLAVCTPAQAQRMRTRVVSAPPGTRVIRSAPQGTTNSASSLATADPRLAVGTTAIPSGSTVDTLINGSYPAPGLGFDFTHHAAVNRNLGVRALVDPITQHRLALAREIRRETPVVPFTGPVVFNSIQINVVPQPPVVIIQEPEPAPEPVERVERVRYVYGREFSRDERVPEPVAAPLPPQEPPREADELVLIRRDGTVLFAVGFTARGDRLIYITREGHRRWVPLAELDLDATRQMNEARGTSLNF